MRTQSAVLRCVCEDATARPIVSGPGEYSRRVPATVKHCPVHFPFAAHSENKPPPRPPAAKSHAVSGVSRGVSQHSGAVSSCDEDAGYVLYQTQAFFYLASHDHSRERWRLAKITRKSNSLSVEEHAIEYTKDDIKTMMSAVARGNEQTGGAEVIARGAGVVTFVHLAATHEEDDPASAAPSGSDAVIKRAEELHRNRMEMAGGGHSLFTPHLRALT